MKQTTIKIELPDYKGYKNFIIHHFYPSLFPFASMMLRLDWHCGYVKIPEEHPYYDISDIHDPRAVALKVHGGITFSEDHTLGFDTNHYDDDPEKLNQEFVVNEIHRLIDQLEEVKNDMQD